MSRRKRSIVKWSILACLIVALLLVGLLCGTILVFGERLAPIQVENKTNEVLTVYIDEYLIGDVKPNDKIKNNLVFYGQDWYLIKAHNAQGNIVYSHKFNDDELKEIDWKIVIPPVKDVSSINWFYNFLNCPNVVTYPISQCQAAPF